MKVESSGQVQSQMMQQSRTDRKDQKSDKREIDDNSKNAETFNISRSKAKAKGVVKKFHDSETHFNGVADLRLRINFAEQLQGLTLPPLSGPKGESSAYSRFLEIYEGLEADVQDTDETLNVDKSGDSQTGV